MKRRSEEADPSRGRGSAAPPSDLELMLWVDGELGGARASEVETYVASHPRAQTVIASLRLGANLLASHVDRLVDGHDVDGIVDDVMDAAEAEASRRFTTPPRRPPAWRTPAIAAIGLAFAAAAALVVVSRSLGRSRLPIPEGQDAVSLLTAPYGKLDDDAAGASVAVVDFGSRPGAVVYMGSDGPTTIAVVWLTDDDVDEGAAGSR
jgi:hypothetical protein